jgi:hypothetical protein
MTKSIPKSLFNKRQIYFPVILLLVFGCDRAKTNEGESELSGKYVNQTFLEAIPDSIPGLVPAYCYEINFISSDSVEILYGFEEAAFGYKKDGKGYAVTKAMQDKDLPFRVNADQTITLIDSGWNNARQNSVFKKSMNNGSQKWDFESYLNQQMIAGTYTLFKNEKPTEQKVILSPDGVVTGMDGYETYSICYSGDCVGEIYPISNSITFTNSKKEAILYAFTNDKKTKKLSIRNIEPPIKDMKGERAIKDIVFDLRQ